MGGSELGSSVSCYDPVTLFWKIENKNLTFAKIRAFLFKVEDYYARLCSVEPCI
jgi:hypothetical protein